MKPRILFILPLPPPVHGSAVVSHQICSSRAVHDAFDCDFVNLSTSRRIEEVGKRSPVKILRFISSYFKTLFKLLTRRYDLCYLAITCYGPSFLKDAPFVNLCRLFGRKIIIHQHNKGMSDYIDLKPYDRILPKVYKDVRVILLSWNLYPDIERVVPKENVVVCPNGIKAAVTGHKERSNTVPRLLFLSNLMVSKGVLVLLDALKTLALNGVSFVCDVVGGETREIDGERFRKEVASRNLESFVTWHGPKHGEEKESFYDNADVFVLPTFYDCFPLVILEAMAHSLPCVTTDEGGIPEMVSDAENGFLCKRQDSDSISEGIQKLLKDRSLRERMGRTGYEMYLDRFTDEAFDRRIVGILESAVLQGRSEA